MLQIRLITRVELPLLFRLRQAVLRTPLGLNLMDEDLTLERSWIKIGGFDSDQNLLACLMLTPINDTTLKLRQMAVDPNYQQIGFGKQIVVFAEVYALMHKYTCITLHARQSAIPFYEKLNYKIVSESFLEVGLPHFKMEKKIGE
jgi:predicted GNAT family N-acyltransferase